jgi:hypothetical protein
MMTDTMDADAAMARDTLSRMLIQWQHSQALIVAAQLGVADLLAEGPRRAEELAGATGTHPRALFRLLRALAGLGVFSILDDGRFALTPLSEPLRSEVPGSLRALAQFFAVEMQAWSALLYSVQTGTSGWERELGIEHYAYFAQNPEASAHYNGAMAWGTARALPDVLAAYDFGGLDTLVDVAGGRGALLAGILPAYPHLQGILLDRPHVVAEAPPALQAAGVADRCKIIGGDFLTDLRIGADAYMLKNVVLGMNDAEAAQVFQASRAAMGPHSRLLVIGELMGSGVTPASAVHADLRMLVIVGEAGVRTEEELRTLLVDAGLRITRIIAAGRAGAIVEAGLT